MKGNDGLKAFFIFVLRYLGKETLLFIFLECLVTRTHLRIGIAYIVSVMKKESSGSEGDDVACRTGVYIT